MALTREPRPAAPAQKRVEAAPKAAAKLDKTKTTDQELPEGEVLQGEPLPEAEIVEKPPPPPTEPPPPPPEPT